MHCIVHTQCLEDYLHIGVSWNREIFIIHDMNVYPIWHIFCALSALHCSAKLLPLDAQNDKISFAHHQYQLQPAVAIISQLLLSGACQDMYHATDFTSYAPSQLFSAKGTCQDTMYIRVFQKTRFQNKNKRNPPRISLGVSLKGSKRIFDFDQV